MVMLNNGGEMVVVGVVVIGIGGDGDEFVVERWRW